MCFNSVLHAFQLCSHYFCVKTLVYIGKSQLQDFLKHKYYEINAYINFSTTTTTTTESAAVYTGSACGAAITCYSYAQKNPSLQAVIMSCKRMWMLFTSWDLEISQITRRREHLYSIYKNIQTTIYIYIYIYTANIYIYIYI